MTSDTTPLFIPAANDIPGVDEVWRFFGNIGQEVEDERGSEEARLLLAYYREAGLLRRPDKRHFFRHHFVENVAAALPILFAQNSRPRLVDLGCGLGTQSILFALCGAQVIGVDLDDRALAVAQRRLDRYEQATGRQLDVRFVHANALEFDFTSLGPLNGVYSLFAFNMIQPTTVLLDRILPALAPRAVVIIQDGNRRMWFNRLFRPRPVMSVRELRQAFNERGLEVTSHGLYALPPVAWLVPFVAPLLDRALRRFELLSGSFLHVARPRL